MEKPNGFTLVELLIAMVLLAFGALTVVQMMLVGMKVNMQTADDTQVATLAQWKIEELTGWGYQNLTPGGDLNTSTTGYTETFTEPGSKVVYTKNWKVVPCGSDTHTNSATPCAISEEYYQTPWYEISVRVSANRQQGIIWSRPREITLRAHVVQPF